MRTSVWIILAIASKIDNSGPMFFKQKRIAQNKNGEKQYFTILKYRSMKRNTPHDMPMHMPDQPEQYITRVGKFLRKSSLDELPQILNIFKEDMSIIGLRPVLWNQDDLFAERGKCGANDVKRGLTGWVQVNGRDELEIPIKAKCDGEYVKNMSFKIYVTWFFMIIANVLRHCGVVEGGTGIMPKSIEKRHNEIAKNG